MWFFYSYIMLIVNLIWFSTPEEICLHTSTKIIKTPATILLHIFIVNWTTRDFTNDALSLNPGNLHLTINHAKISLHVLIISYIYIYSTERNWTFRDTIAENDLYFINSPLQLSCFLEASLIFQAEVYL